MPFLMNFSSSQEEIQTSLSKLVSKFMKGYDNVKTKCSPGVSEQIRFMIKDKNYVEMKQHSNVEIKQKNNSIVILLNKFLVYQ